jgi:cold shock CspA family protein
VLQKQNHNDEALKLMYQATRSNYKLESMVTLFLDIGQLCTKMEKYQEARAHLVLCKFVRENNDWGVPEALISSLSNISPHFKDSGPISQKEAYDICRNEWDSLLLVENAVIFSSKKRELRRDLIGTVNSIRDDRSFFFINTADESIFCSISEIMPTVKNGDKVHFDAVPSFDKKKDKESWRATNIRLTI